MSQTDGSGNFVDILASMAAGPHGGNLDIFGLDDDVVAGDFGKDDNGSGAGMNATMLLGNGDPLDAVSAGFKFELVVGIKAANFDNIVVKIGDFPANLVSKADVHFAKIVHPEIRLFATRTGAKLENGNVGVDCGHSLKKAVKLIIY